MRIHLEQLLSQNRQRKLHRGRKIQESFSWMMYIYTPHQNELKLLQISSKIRKYTSKGYIRLEYNVWGACNTKKYMTQKELELLGTYSMTCSQDQNKKDRPEVNTIWGTSRPEVHVKKNKHQTLNGPMNSTTAWTYRHKKHHLHVIKNLRNKLA